MKHLFVYISGLLFLNSLLLLWFYSPLKISLAKFLFKQDILAGSEFDDILFLKNKLLGKLTSCWVCLSFWLSLFIGIFLSVIFNLSPFYPILTFFTYPCLAYIYKKIIS